MAKKNVVIMHCPICNKTTAHEIRVVDGQKTCVCLACDKNLRNVEDAALRYKNRLENEHNQTERALDEERIRMNPPIVF
jgi:hypothetical protein